MPDLPHAQTPMSPHTPNLSLVDRSADRQLPSALTDLRAALEALAVAQQELAAAAAVRVRANALLDLLPDTCLLTDPAGVIREANRATSAFVGHARRYVLGKPLAAFITPAERTAFARLLATLAQLPDGKQATATLAVRPQLRGEPLTVRAWVRPICGVAGLERALLWLLRDITAETATAAAYAKLQADQAQQLRTRTMELEAVLRMRDATLAAERAALASLVAAATPATEDPPATVLARLVAGLQRLLTSGAPMFPADDDATEDE